MSVFVVSSDVLLPRLSGAASTLSGFSQLLYGWQVGRHLWTWVVG